ncbi:MAG: glycosyltransferase [Planctomycetes bacterium]|nr:glycosyltransferase [Planctomycetota bacterium]
MNEPFLLTVVIPTVDRAGPLLDVLDDLAAQDDPCYEVLVVDQSSAPNADLARRAALSIGAVNGCVRYVRLRTRSLPHARNAGLSLARGEVILFLDDDVRFDATLVRRHRENFADPGVAAVAGRITGGYEQVFGSWRGTGRIFRFWPMYLRNFDRRRRCRVEHLPGGHHSVRAALIREAGGFDETFSGVANICEESDMAHRLGAVARRRGMRMVFDPRATLHHLRLPTGGCRERDDGAWVYWHAHNVMLLFLRHYPRLYLPLYLLWVTLRAARLARREGNIDRLRITWRGTRDAFRTFARVGRRARHTPPAFAGTEPAADARAEAASADAPAGGQPCLPRAVLEATDYFLPGEGRAYFDNALCFRARGCHVEFLATVPAGGPADGETWRGVRLHALPPADRASPRRFLRETIGAFQVRFERLLRERAFDLCVLHGPLAGRAYGLARAPRGRPKPPAIYVFHSPWAAEHAVKARRAGEPAWKVRAGMFPRDHLEAAAIAPAARVVTLSRYMRALLGARHPGLADGRWRLIRGWADLAHFNDALPREKARERLGLAPGPGPLLLTIRRLESRMGLDVLLEAFRAVLDREAGARLIIGGAGPREADLRRQASRLGLDGAARFWGYVDDEHIPLLYRAADLFVLPTQELEGFGLVTVEALACGTPVLGTPVGGTAEILAELDPALLFPGLSAADMAPAILRATRSEWMSLDAARRCRRYATDRYSFDRGADEYLALAREVLDEHLPNRAPPPWAAP